MHWLSCQSGNLATIATDLQRQLGLKIDGDLNQIVTELESECARKRTLLILDNVEDESPAALLPGGAASVLVTTRQPGLRFLRNHPRLPVELFTEDQCFQLFREVLGDQEVSTQEADCRKLFKRVEYLPIAVSILASLIKDDVRYTIASVAANLPADATELIKQAINALSPEPCKLLSAMGACAPESFSLSLAASLTELAEPASLEALQQLTSRSLVEEIHRTNRRYRLHALVREAADGREFRQLHAEVVYKRFEKWETNWQQCEQDTPDFQTALTWALANRKTLPELFSGDLAFYGVELNRRIGHPRRGPRNLRTHWGRC